MERIVYRITLDSHKTGIQRTLQGFETADNMARTIAVNITASGDTYEIPLDNVVAMMYVTTPGASEPSINECRIEDNTIIYDVLPIVEEGITEMKIKLIETSVDGAKRVLLAPKFVVEVTESGTEDDSAEQTTTFTALENAIAKAHGVYDQRLLNIEIGPDCVFRAIYADGTVYENHYLHEALYNGNALLSESWAKGGTGVREGEDVNNSLYFSNVSRSASAEAKQNASAVRELTDMARLYSTYTSFDTNFATGELEYISATHNFDVDETTGELVVEGETFEPDAIVEKAVGEFLEEKTQAISKNAEDIAENTKDISEVRGDLDNHTHTAEEVGARSNTWMPSAKDVGASPSDHSHSAEEVGAHPNTWMPTASDVGARPNTWMPTATEIGALPNTGGTVTGNTTFNAIATFGSVVYFRGDARENEGGQVIFAKPPNNSAFASDITMDICENQIRWFSDHSGLVKIFTLDFSLVGDSGNANIYHTKSIIGSNTDLVAHTSGLTTDFIYQVYE